MSKNKSKKNSENTIVENRKVRHDYFIEETFQAGIVLEGWEVKSLRIGKAQIQEAYVRIHRGEAYLIGAHISVFSEAQQGFKLPDPTRSRKLLLSRRELNKLIGATQREGYTLVPVNLHWSKGKAKALIGLAKGKKQQDKRASEKSRDWNREKARLLKEQR